MAESYTLSEAVKIIVEGTDAEKILDIGRRFPLVMQKVSKVGALAGESFIDLMSYIPEFITANKLNMAMKKALIEGDGTVETEKTRKSSTMPDYESMKEKELWEILGQRNARATAKSHKKADLVEACKALHKRGRKPKLVEVEEEVEEQPKKRPGRPAKIAKPVEVEPEELEDYDEDEWEPEEEVQPKKQRGRPAKAKQEEPEDDDEPDWDDEEDEEPAPKKKASVKAKEERKAKKHKQDDDDDDWDI